MDSTVYRENVHRRLGTEVKPSAYAGRLCLFLPCCTGRNPERPNSPQPWTQHVSVQWLCVKKHTWQVVRRGSAPLLITFPETPLAVAICFSGCDPVRSCRNLSHGVSDSFVWARSVRVELWLAKKENNCPEYLKASACSELVLGLQ